MSSQVHLQLRIKGIRSVERYKRRLKKGNPFLPFSHPVISGCQLRCQGVGRCRGAVEAPVARRSRPHRDDANAWKSYFGIWGEPSCIRNCWSCSRVIRIAIQSSPRALITDEVARELRRLKRDAAYQPEGSESVSDVRRGRRTCSINRSRDSRTAAVISCSSASRRGCQSNVDELVTDAWLRRLISMACITVVHTYRVSAKSVIRACAAARAGDRCPSLHRSAQKKPIAIVDAYGTSRGALCPMAPGSATTSALRRYRTMPLFSSRARPFATATASSTPDAVAFLRDFRTTAAHAPAVHCVGTPDLVRELVVKTAPATPLSEDCVRELEKLQPRNSQHNPGQEIPEDHWAYRLAKKHWFFGFGAYT